MQVYHVIWELDPSLASDGRVKKDEKTFIFSILTDSRVKVVRAFETLFHRTHLGRIDPSDGKLLIVRSKVDSRNLCFNYMMIEGMDEPLYLPSIRDPKRNNFYNIFGIWKNY